MASRRFTSRVALREAVVRDIELEVAALAGNVTRELAVATPRDTGFAAGEWMPSLGRPKTPPGPFFYAAMNNRAMRAQSVGFTSSTQGAGIDAIRAFRLKHVAIYITSYVTYLPRLFAGSSSKAPAGWQFAAIDRAMAMTRATRS